MESGDGRVYKETVYRPKDTHERALKKRRLIMIAVVVLLLIIIIALIIGVAVNANKKSDNRALVVYPDGDGHPIAFKQGVSQSYKGYKSALQTVLKDYERENQSSEKFLDCTGGIRPPPNTDSVCRFRLELLGPQCTAENDFGMMEGQPCFLLQLTPPKGWTPEFFTNSTLPEDVPANTEYTSNVPVHCKASIDEVSKDVGEVQMYPPDGFSTSYFPYTGQADYKSPLVMVRFMKPKSGVDLLVTCTVLDPSLTDDNNQDFITDFVFRVD